MRLIPVAAAVLLALPGAALADTPLALLKAAMAERLAAMPDVARHKWNSGAAVEDRAQEARVVEGAVAAGQELGLAPEVVRSVAIAQIEAAKLVQSALIEQWQAEAAAKFTDVPDLAAVLRPAIGSATEAIIGNLKPAAPALRECAGAGELRAVPEALASYAAAWQVAADGVIAAQGGPARTACPG
ncbi:gamma subclass chorismate mutase AroQ [Geminicoccus harenae]|uniref:gamma subclass chorismate mutase AroQ n=1 Tax=Geminicoccus harenae TaxID=2498453 RepID=UPI00168A43C6|nr:gamma subclass chorismate mutase AroQ [Geminicoccus harenae]